MRMNCFVLSLKSYPEAWGSGSMVDHLPCMHETQVFDTQYYPPEKRRALLSHTPQVTEMLRVEAGLEVGLLTTVVV